MALKLYNPRTQAFSVFTAPQTDIPLLEMLLLNVLIEMQVQSEYLSSIAGINDTPEQLRTDKVSEV